MLRVIVAGLLLVSWIVFSANWYVCKIKKACIDATEQTAKTYGDSTLTKEIKTQDSSKVITNSAINIKTEIAPFVDISFASASIRADYNAKNLELWLSRAKETGNILLVSGHTDATGTKELNRRLSKQRAEAMAEQLVELGFEIARIKTEGLADAYPIASNQTPEGRAKNRRVEIKSNSK
jgi:outer membrane protein OmpA-like peptidoglycan-associated protein